MQTVKILNTQTVWNIDAVHSAIKFSVRHIVISKVTGSFGEFSGEITSNGDDFSNAYIEFKAKINSINTGKPERDIHLKGEDFFDAAKHPELTFKSTSITKKTDSEYSVIGDLTLRGITKPISLTVQHGGIIKDPWGFERAGFVLKGHLNRFDYNLKWNQLLETGGAIVSDVVDIECDIEIVTKKD